MDYELINQVAIWIVLGIIGIFGLYKTQIAPAQIREKETKLKAQLEALEDSREHKQALENEQMRLGALSQSWANEKLFEESHENNVFLRGDVTGSLSELKGNDRKILMEIQDLKSKFTLLLGILADMRDKQDKQNKDAEH